MSRDTHHTYHQDYLNIMSQLVHMVVASKLKLIYESDTCTIMINRMPKIFGSLIDCIKQSQKKSHRR